MTDKLNPPTVGRQTTQDLLKESDLPAMFERRSIVLQPEERARQMPLQNFLENIDFFPYNEPIKERRSAKSGICTILAMIFGVIFSILLLVELIEARETINREYVPMPKTPEWPNITQPVPQFLIQPGGEMWKEPYKNNPSYYTIEMNHNTIWESYKCKRATGCKDKTLVKSGVCEVSLGYGDKLEGYCPDDQSNLPKVLGMFEDPRYDYITIDVTPCRGKPTCAPLSDIKALFWGNRSTVSIWTQEGHGDDVKWTSRVYRNFENGFWVGIETYFQPKRHLERNVFDAIRVNFTELVFHRTELRRGVLEDEIMRIYFRMSTSAIKENTVVMTFLGFLTKLGGIFSLVILIFGNMGRFYNRSKSYVIRRAKKKALANARGKEIAPYNIGEIGARPGTGGNTGRLWQNAKCFSCGKPGNMKHPFYPNSRYQKRTNDSYSLNGFYCVCNTHRNYSPDGKKKPYVLPNQVVQHQGNNTGNNIERQVVVAQRDFKPVMYQWQHRNDNQAYWENYDQRLSGLLEDALVNGEYSYYDKETGSAFDLRQWKQFEGDNIHTIQRVFRAPDKETQIWTCIQCGLVQNGKPECYMCGWKRPSSGGAIPVVQAQVLTEETKKNKDGLDVVLIFDYNHDALKQFGQRATQNIAQLFNQYDAAQQNLGNEGTKLRIGFIIVGKYNDDVKDVNDVQNNILPINVFDLTDSVEDIAKFLDLNGKPVQHVPNNNDKRLSYELALFQARKLSWLANTRKIFLFSSNDVVPYDRNEKYNIMQLEWRQESQLLAASGVVFYNFLKTQQTNGSAWQKYICNLSGGTDAKYDITGLEDVIIKMTLLGMKKNINRTNENGDDEQKEGN